MISLTEFIKYRKIRRLGHKTTKYVWDGHTVVEEKIDGANFRFMADPELGLRWGSRNGDYTFTDPKHWPNRFKNQWKWVVDNYERIERCCPGMVFFAEATLQHTIPYDYNRFKAPLIGFDIWYDGDWIPYPENKKLFKKIGLPFVPVIAEFDDKPKIDDFTKLIPKSQFYDGIAEGVVIKNYELGIFAKIISEKFDEVKHSIFGKSKKKIKDETAKWFEYLFSQRRVEKKIYELYDEGHDLSMKMMKPLIDRIIEDAVIEEGVTFFRKAGAVNIRRMRKMLSKRTQNILQRMMALKTLTGELQ